MAHRLALVGGQVLMQSGELENYTLLLESDRISGLLSPGEQLPYDTDILSVNGAVVAPGFIDSHVHGGGGFNFMAGETENFPTISRHMACGGVTSCLATTTSASPAGLQAALAGAVAIIQSPRSGQVQIVGIHLEGPFINPEFRGAHVIDYIRTPTVNELQDIVRIAGSCLKIVTLAPEIPAGLDAVRFLAQQGIQVSIGHSSANYQQAKAALVAGVRRGTHVFNTMPPIHHRAPGPVIALLEDATAFIELIVDGYHIAPPVVAMVLRLIGPDRGILITDGVDAAGQGDGVYTRWEGTKVIVSDGQVKTEKNVLAGSTLRMNEAVANLVRLVGVPLPAALRMASENPARAIGILDRKGTITPGKDADVVVLNDDFSVRYTIIQGEIAYEQSE